MADDPLTLEGALSIAAAIEAGRREIYQILIEQDKRYDRRLSGLRQLARKAGILLSYVSTSELQQYVSGRSHGGAVALVGERGFDDLQDLISTTAPAFIVMLDGIEDPYNFGFAVRALYAAGADGIVLRQRNWTSASAGAVERTPMAIAEGATQAAAFYQQQGLIVATAAKAASSVSLFEADLTKPLFVLVGGGRRGVTRSFLRQADLLLEIPYARAFKPSLGSESAVSVLAYEVMRQRGATAPGGVASDPGANT